jgi:hypothetical protein
MGAAAAVVVVVAAVHNMQPTPVLLQCQGPFVEN